MSIETTGHRSLRLRKRFGISRRTLAVIIDCHEMTLMRAELEENHKLHPHIERRLEKVCDILEARAEVEDKAIGGQQ
jgi:DNA-binding XRE family transcriptional regulator